MSVPAKQPTAIQLRRGTAAYWTSIDVGATGFVPRNGEPIYETDTGKVKIGDGIQRWALLDYLADTVNLSNTTNTIDSLYDVTITPPVQNDQGIIYENGLWKNKTVVAAASVAKTKPSPATDGALWFDPEDGRLYRYYSDANTSQWVEIKQAAAEQNTFASPVTMQSTLNVTGATTLSSTLNVTGTTTLPSQTKIPGAIVQVQHVRTNSAIDITAQNIAAISGLSISFTPKFANSKILLTSMINSNAQYVTSYGFLKDGVSLGTTSPNSNTTSSVWTGYSGQAAGITTNMYGAYTEWLDDATNTSARTYAAGITSSWADIIYTVRINDRTDNVMRSYSSMTIYEIAQ